MPSRSPLNLLAEDLYQLRLPLPFALNHVNIYLLRGPQGWTILDTGLNTPPAQAVWRAALTELGHPTAPFATNSPHACAPRSFWDGGLAARAGGR